MAGNNSIRGDETVTFTDNMSFDGTERDGAMTTDGELWIGSTALPHVRKGTLTAGTGITITPSAGSIEVASTASLTDLHTAKFIVGDTANGANYSTIAAAITAASSGDIIFIQGGTYTENLAVSKDLT